MKKVTSIILLIVILIAVFGFAAYEFDTLKLKFSYDEDSIENIKPQNVIFQPSSTGNFSVKEFLGLQMQFPWENYKSTISKNDSNSEGIILELPGKKSFSVIKLKPSQEYLKNNPDVLTPVQWKRAALYVSPADATLTAPKSEIKNISRLLPIKKTILEGEGRGATSIYFINYGKLRCIEYVHEDGLITADIEFIGAKGKEYMINTNINKKELDTLLTTLSLK